MNAAIDNAFVINLRKYLNLSQSDFAEILNVNISTLRQVEQKRRGVPKTMQQNIQEKYANLLKSNLINETNISFSLSADVKAILNLCEYYGLSQTELSQRIGVSRQIINELFNAKNNKKLTPKIKLAIENEFGSLVNYYDDNQVKVTNRFVYVRLKVLSKSQKEFAKILGIPLPKLIDIENNKKSITKQMVDFLEKEYLVNHQWLLTGKGNITKIEEDEETLTKNNNIPTNITTVPFYSAKASAGAGETLPYYPEKDVIYFDKRWLKNVLGIRNERNLSIIQAKGNSMDGGNNPIKDGDLLLVDCSVKEGNNVFVIRQDDELRVKKIKWNFDGTAEIISNNSEYKTERVGEEITPYVDFEIIGKVVWNGSKENV